MRVNDITKVKPAKEYVVVENIELDKDSELFFAKSKTIDVKNADLSIGKVLATGPMSDQPEFSPGVVPGDTVTYNVFSGSHIATTELAKLYKIMSGYNIIAKLDDVNNLDENTVHPSSNRLFLAVKFIDETDSGLFIPAADASDPRLEDLDYGTVISVGPSCKLGYKVGDIVAYNPYSGENVRPPRSVSKPALRILIEEDVLLTI
jgi:co-chaperonin GroES (HSP10)